MCFLPATLYLKQAEPARGGWLQWRGSCRCGHILELQVREGERYQRPTPSDRIEANRGRRRAVPIVRDNHAKAA
jgi:hypothetical protein